MHLAEGILPLEQAAVWTAVAAPMLAWSIHGERQARLEKPTASLVMSAVTSLLFAATMLPLPVPVVGATSHICLTPVLALLVGIRRIFWPTFFVLFLQAVFFAHGGLTTLGVNTLALGWVGPLVALGAWNLLRRLGTPASFGLAVACGLGGLSVYVADAMVLAFALSDVAAPSSTFVGVFLGFAPVQIPLALLEGLASVAMIRLLAERRPDLLPDSLRSTGKSSKLAGSFLLVLIVVSLSGCDYKGIDESVFGMTATMAGRTPTQSLVDLSVGEFGQTLSIFVLLGLGFIAGRGWERMFGGGRDAFPR